VSASGKALQRGCAGEKIKVQNIDSNRIIVAKINEDGSVEPVF
jgi:flagella basal body P-ring formation protein FlgA